MNNLLSFCGKIAVATTEARNRFYTDPEREPTQYTDLKANYFGIMGHETALFAGAIETIGIGVKHFFSKFLHPSSIFKSKKTLIFPLLQLGALVCSPSLITGIGFVASCTLYSKSDSKKLNVVLRDMQCSIYKLKRLIMHHPTGPDFAVLPQQKSHCFLEKYVALFKSLNASDQSSQKFVCAYFLPKTDSSGAYFSMRGYFKCMEQIQTLQKSYAVFAEIICSQDEILEVLLDLKKQFPERKTKLVIISGHGNSQSVRLDADFLWKKKDIYQGEFQCVLAQNSDIYLTGCSTARGDNSFAETLAQRNPGVTVHGATSEKSFEFIKIEKRHTGPLVAEIQYHTSLDNKRLTWHKCRAFKFPDLQLIKNYQQSNLKKPNSA